jgi:hypothetical protein
MAPSLTKDLCAMCSQHGAMQCAGCKELRYCSKGCQKNDWPIHKLVCKTLKDFSADNRPGPNYKRAILFPQDGENPHFFWLKFLVPGDFYFKSELDEGKDIPLWKTRFNPNTGEYDCSAVEVFHSVVLDRPLENKFSIMGKTQEADTLGSIPNHEVNKSLIKVNKELQDVWYGPIIAFGREAKDTGRSYDIGPLEFRHTVDALRMRYDEIEAQRQNKVTGPYVMGVRISNTMDQQWGKREPITRLHVSASQCAAESDIEASVCDQIGIPLVLRRLPLALTGRDRRLVTPIVETVGHAPLLRALNPRLSLFDDRHGVGSAIVVRKDGKPLCEEHVQAFARYASFMMEQEDLKSPVDPDKFSSAFSKEKFVNWYADYKEFMKATGEPIDHIPSPHDL